MARDEVAGPVIAEPAGPRLRTSARLHATTSPRTIPSESRRRRAWATGLIALAAEPALAQDEPPVQLGASYVSDALANLSGGIREGARVLGKLDLTATLDGRLLGVDGATVFVNLQHVHGEPFSEELVGDAQVVSNIEAPTALRPLEAWVELPLLGDDSTVKAGLIDLNTEFDRQEVGALFLNSSHGIGPDFSQTGLNGPSIFPTTATAIVVRHEAADWALRVGLFDAVAGDPDRPSRTVVRFPGSSGTLLVAEGELKLGEADRLAVGTWTYTSRFDDLEATNADGDPVRRSDNRGAYATVEKRLLTDTDGSTLDSWVRLGIAEPSINPIGLSVGVGVSFGNDERRVGIAVAHARLGDPAIRAGSGSGAGVDRAETNIEFTYAHSFGERVTIQPDIQYIINPGWDRGLADALVAGVRVKVSLF